MLQARAIHRPIRSLLLIVLALAALPVWSESSSPSYVLKQSTVNTGGEARTSASYNSVGSLGQEATIGTSSSNHYVVQSGFWGFVGSGLVPVWLFADRNLVNPDNVDLTWTGNNPPYDIYQSTNCTNVFGTYYATTPANGMANVPPPVATLICYSVRATAPGPFQSPFAP